MPTFRSSISSAASSCPDTQTVAFYEPYVFSFDQKYATVLLWATLLQSMFLHPIFKRRIGRLLGNSWFTVFWLDQCVQRPSLKRMQLTFTACVESLNTHDDGQVKTYRSCQTHETLLLHYLLSTGRHLLSVSFITSLKSNLRTALSTIQNICIISHAQNTTVYF
jgi:hypothetical protein